MKGRWIAIGLLLLGAAAYGQTDTTAVDTTVVTVSESVAPTRDSVVVLHVPDSVVASGVTERQPKKASIYQGVIVKLDLGAAALAMGVSKARMQQWEVAANVRLKNRFYPTFELGYAGGTTSQGDTVSYQGHGGFFRIGCDINPLKKHPERPHALLVGVRLGTSVQGARQGATDATWRPYKKQADCWGEIVLGCQVNIVKGLYMGWMGRLKILFTREAEELTTDQMGLVYIPGFGKRGDIGYGLCYHIGWKF